MTVGYLMDRLREVRSCPYSDASLYDELARLETMIQGEIHARAETVPPPCPAPPWEFPPVRWPVPCCWHDAAHAPHEEPEGEPPEDSGEEQDSDIVRLIPGEDDEHELLVPMPYDQMYLHWMCAQIDQRNMEYETAQTEMTMFQGLYQEYSKRYRREHMPRRGGRLRRYV